MYTGPALIAALFLASQIPAGTTIEARLRTTIRTATSQVGDEVVASLTENVSSANKILIPRGSMIRGRVETVQPANRNLAGRVRLVFREIELPGGNRLPTFITNSFSASPPKRTTRYIAYTAAGATAGGLIGRKAARVTGILGGAIVGFLIAGSRNGSELQNLTLRSGQEIRLELREDLIRTSAR